MKWYTIVSVILFGLNSVLATIVLSLVVYYLTTNKGTNAPTVPNEEWINLVTSLVSLAALWMVLSIFGIFVSMMRRQILLASLVLIFYGAIFGGAIYFTVAFASQLEMEDVKAEDLFSVVLKEISTHSPKLWIPPWLDNIQKKSKQCCGIITYRDYEDFWPAAPTKISRSCCRDVKEIPDSCPEDLTKIPYPNTPDNYIKVEVGCMQEINEATRCHIKETLDLCITTTTFLACGLLAFSTLYIYRYIIGNKAQSKPTVTPGKPIGDGDAFDSQLNNGPLFAASSGQILGSINSFGGIPNFVSAESILLQERKVLFIPEVPPPPSSQQPPPERAPERAPERVPERVPLPREPLPISAPPPPPMRSQPSFIKPNRANTVFAGLQKQASTGDDMTVGGGNLGRREVFYVQEKVLSSIPEVSSGQRLNTASNTRIPEVSSGQRLNTASNTRIPEVSSGQRLNMSSNTRIPASGSQNDMAGDIVHVDQDAPTNLPNNREKEKKKKKGKKVGMPYGHNHQHHSS